MNRVQVRNSFVINLVVVALVAKVENENQTEEAAGRCREAWSPGIKATKT
jgi:hypothetical protein